MSLYVGSSSSNYALKTTGLINHNQPYTWMGWVTLVSDTNGFGHIWAPMGSATDTFAQADWIGTASDGTTLRWASYVGGVGSSTTGSSLTVGTPVHLALVRTSTTNLIAYLNGVQIGSAITTDVGSRAATQREQLGSANATFPCPCNVMAMKQWQTALTAAEIAAEMKSIRLIRMTDLHAWHPAINNTLANALLDHSGNSRNWGTQGTIAVSSSSAPVSWGTSPIVMLTASGPVTHTTTSTIVGPGSSVSGSATHTAGPVTHTTTSTIVGSGSAVSGPATHTAAPVITTDPLKNNTATILANETGITACVYNPVDGTLIVRKTELTTNASGVLTFSDVLLQPTTTYWVVIETAAGNGVTSEVSS